MILHAIAHREWRQEVQQDHQDHQDHRKVGDPVDPLDPVESPTAHHNPIQYQYASR